MLLYIGQTVYDLINILLKKFLESLYAECTYDFHVYIVDNESEFKLETPTEKCNCIRIDNQQEKGLTGVECRIEF